MSEPSPCAERLLGAWGRRPSGALAAALRRFYGRHVLSLPLPLRARLCMALGEAAEAEERHAVARYLYGAAVAAIDPRRDERAYAAAALRALLSAWRTGDRATLAGVARLVGRLPAREVTPRLLLIGAFARGLGRLLEGRGNAARRSFEGAREAARAARDAGGEVLANHLLAWLWGRLGRVGRAREHAAAARSAAARAGSWLLERRMELEEISMRLAVRPSAEALAEAHRYLRTVRRQGFPKLEGLGWLSLARSLRGEGAAVRTFLRRAKALLPEAARGAGGLRRGSGEGPAGRSRSDRGLARALGNLIRLARG